METVLLVIHMMLGLSLIAVILVQRTSADGGGLTGGGSTMGGLFTARGSANLLTRTTAILATLFIITSLVLGIVASRSHSVRNVIQGLAPAQKIEGLAPAPLAIPTLPVEKKPAPSVPLAK